MDLPFSSTLGSPLITPDLAQILREFQNVLATLKDITQQLADLQEIRQKLSILDFTNTRVGQLSDIVNNISVKVDRLADDCRSLSSKCATLEYSYTTLEQRLNDFTNDLMTLSQTARLIGFVF